MTLSIKQRYFYGGFDGAREFGGGILYQCMYYLKSWFHCDIEILNFSIIQQTILGLDSSH